VRGVWCVFFGYAFLLLGVLATFVLPRSQLAYDIPTLIGIGIIVVAYFAQKAQS